METHKKVIESGSLSFKVTSEILGEVDVYVSLLEKNEHWGTFYWEVNAPGVRCKTAEASTLMPVMSRFAGVPYLVTNERKAWSDWHLELSVWLSIKLPELEQAYKVAMCYLSHRSERGISEFLPHVMGDTRGQKEVHADAKIEWERIRDLNMWQTACP